MKTILTLAIIVGFALWCPSNVHPTIARGAFDRPGPQTCGCNNLTEIRNRLRAVEAAVSEIEKRREEERWQEPFSAELYQNQLVPLIERAMGAANSAGLGRPLGSIDPNSCVVRSETSQVSACLLSAISKNLETRKFACQNWRDGDGRTGTDYRTGNPMSQILDEEIGAYTNEATFLKAELFRLESIQCKNGKTGASSTGYPPPIVPPGSVPSGTNPRTTGTPVTIPSGTLPPGTVPPRQIPPGGLPIGIPPGGGPPTGGPPVLPPIPPPDDPPIVPPSGTGGRRTSGYVQIILDLVLPNPILGNFYYMTNSRIPFNITQNRVTGGGTTVMEIVPPPNCTVSNFDATVDVTVSGQQIGNYMDVTVTRQPSGVGPSFAEKVENIGIICDIRGQKAVAFNVPNLASSNVTPAVRQRLPLPRIGGPPTTTIVPIQGFPGRIVLRVYRP